MTRVVASGRAERPEAGAASVTCAPATPVAGFRPYGPPTARIRGPRGARGFTLLEVLLAFALLAAAMGLLIGMLSGGLRQVADAERETEATLYAQSLLDELGTLEPLKPGQREGTFADRRFRWMLAIAEVDDPAPVSAAATGTVPVPLEGGPQVLRVVLDIEWGDGGPRRRLQVVTLRSRQPTELGIGTR
jgi:general secretion pathway protein I